MADTIGVIVTGDTKLGIRFDQFPQQAHDKLRDSITTQIAALRTAIKAAAPRRTGKLASQVDSNVVDKPDRIKGIVYFDGDYAKVSALEYGVHRSVQVAAHSATLDHVFREKLMAPLRVFVEAHSRSVDLAAREFIRGPARAMQGQITQQLREAVNEAIDETS